MRNFVDDTYLEQFYPDLINFRKGSQQDYSAVISTAFSLTLNDLENRGIDTRLCMVPLDLNRSRTATQNIQQLTSTTVSATTNGTHWEGGMQRRFVVNITNKSVHGDDWSVLLQGSNLTTEPDEADASWETVVTLPWVADAAASEDHETFTASYKWYRVRVVKNSGSGSITFTASLYETKFDSIIAYKAIGLIARSWDTGMNPKFQVMAEAMENAYTSGLQGVKFSYDHDQDGIPEITEPTRSSGVRLSR